MVIRFAHRGSLTEAPENTIPSFQRAVENGAGAIELDVQLTKDGQLVICHDENIERVARGNKGYIGQYTLRELKGIDIGSSFSEDFKGVTFCTLSDVLDICPPLVTVNVEIKNIPVFYDGIAQKVMDCLNAYDRLDNVIISSFDHVVLEEIQQLDPNVPIGLLFSIRIIDPWKYAKSTGLNVFSLHPHWVFVNESYINQSHEAGYKVIPYTVNDLNEFQRLEKLGIDGVFTNNPEIFSL